MVEKCNCCNSDDISYFDDIEKNKLVVLCNNCNQVVDSINYNDFPPKPKRVTKKHAKPILVKEWYYDIRV